MQDANSLYLPRQLASTDPDRLAFQMCNSGEAVTYQQLEARANQGAHLLRDQGIEIGDHILILMENRRAFLEICFAADRSGVYYTTVSTYLTLDELAYIAQNCGAKLAIISDRFIELASQLQALGGADLNVRIVGEAPDTLDSWDEAAARCPVTPIADEQQGLDMLYSSGTTGRPKGIKWPLTGEQPGAPSMLVTLLTGLFGYDEHSQYLCPAPLYHAAPLRHTMVVLKVGGTASIMEKFDATRALELIEKVGITHSQWVPTMFIRMLKLPENVRRSFDLSTMRMAVHAAAPCPVETKQAMMQWWGPIIHEYYAGTENNGFTAITPEEWLTHQGSVGCSKLGIIHIVDADGIELPVGQTGDIFFEGGHQFAYHNDPKKTASSTNAHGWTTLGDVGWLDEAGYLYLTDRKSFMIISGGVNIYPQEAEDALLAHPAVLDAAVIGIPNEEFGEEVKAVVQLVAGVHGGDDLANALIHHCRERLSAIKCPRSIDFTDALPRTETGKLLKRKLIDAY